MRRCQVKRCRNPARKGRKKCEMHQKRQWRRDNPIKAQFARIRDKAKQRGIFFGLPFETFKKFCEDHNYCESTGLTLSSMNIDRIDNRLGYVEGNIQPLSLEKNLAKRFKFDQRRMETGYAWRGGG